ncbi:right-handed parallel beta-helix repeat-containing protein, partial [Candidatus Micrarchaeota archaeon]|nr:right-handed parallel beta-helix repeat-containing protein [Candidatus Micrarchaeota archaeon]
ANTARSNLIANSTVLNGGIGCNGSSNNVFSGLSVASPINLEQLCDNNTFSGINVTAENVYGAFTASASKNNTLILSKLTNTKTAASGIYLANSNLSLFRNNTIIAPIAVSLTALSRFNLFYWNNMSATTTWVSNLGDNNWFNTSVNGFAQGNIYPNASAYNIVDVDGDGFAESGPHIPFSLATLGATLWPSSKGADYGPYAPENIGCQNLSVAGTVYNLTHDAISTSGTCFIAAASNITLNCNGHAIRGVNASGSYGFYANSSISNATIKNCIISNFTYGIYFNSAHNGIIENNTVSTTYASAYAIYLYNGADSSYASSGYGIYLSSGANSNNLTSNIAYSAQSHSLVISSSHLNNITGNAITSGSTASDTGALYLASSDSNYIANNNATISVGMGAIYALSSDYNVLTNNVGTSLGAGYGIYIYTSSDSNILQNNRGTSATSGSGISLFTNTNNTLTNNTGISTSGGFGIRLAGATYSSLFNNTGSSRTSDGIYLISSNSSTLSQNNGSSDSSYGIFVLGSSNNTLSSDIANSNRSAALHLANSTNNTFTGISAYATDNTTVYLLNSTSNSFFHMAIEPVSAQKGIYLAGSANNYFYNVSNAYTYNSSSVQKFYSDSAQNISSDLNIGWWPLQGANGISATGQINTSWYNRTNGRNYDWSISELLAYWYAPTPAEMPIYFVPPTAGDNATTTNTTAFVNITLNSTDIANFTWGWNSSNYSIYDSGLVLMLNLDLVGVLNESGASTHAHDVSLGANHGTCIGMGASCSWKPDGKYASTILFDGTNDYINVSTSGSLEPSQISFGAWVRSSGGGSNASGNYVLSYGRQAGAQETSYGIKYSPLTGLFSCIASIKDSNYTASSTTATPDGPWSHIMCTYDGLNLRLYLNGVNEDTTNKDGTINYSISDNALHIGDLGADGKADSFEGDIDEVRIYGRALTYPQILQQYYSNLYRPALSQWQFYTQQPMVVKPYDYFGYAKDIEGRYNQTEVRTITRSS